MELFYLTMWLFCQSRLVSFKVWAFPGLFFKPIFSQNSLLFCYHLLSPSHVATSTPLMIYLTMELSRARTTYHTRKRRRREYIVCMDFWPAFQDV